MIFFYASKNGIKREEFLFQHLFLGKNKKKRQSNCWRFSALSILI